MAPQYYKNELQLIELGNELLHQVRAELREAVKCATGILKVEDPEPHPDDSNAFGTIYNGSLGIALTFLRLEEQVSYIANEGEIPSLASELVQLASSRINPNVSGVSQLRTRSLSPLASGTLGASLVRILAAITRPTPRAIDSSDLNILQNAAELSLKQGTMLGGDEALYGRVGLLWALLYIRQHCLDEENMDVLIPLFTMIPRIVNVILETGRLGADEYQQLYGQQSVLPLMWPWHGKYYIGAIHGTAGILAILLSCKLEELDDGATHHLPIIAQTINSLCRLTIENGGHLPSSLPIHSSSRHSPYVQICHGSPGLLILLAQARSIPDLTRSFWEPDWDKAIRLGSEQVWEQGLLFKGGGLCHGIAGNAWPFLMLHDSFEYGQENIAQANLSFRDRTGIIPSEEEDLTPDYFLSRALSLLLYAQKTPPFHRRRSPGELQFRMPDTPYSLFEGLAGTCAAWAEACVVIEARLRKNKLDEEGSGAVSEKRDELLSKHLNHELGFPGITLGGIR
ncbi:uncharacterized protein PADG_02916 [Paracoccidioides brasiliensis Pb18]|uniref:Lanthionine synthetase C family protein n=2 Tax=Paracoccidioides brasiliensis TaxID=121759 RepID=C1G6W1_PARBD|nr:uncharacterized protein PADG_02916 [Paracoccidioides brasiliensis Pb18]EEH46818.2 hypothetical protein PADG_02916 [Paracoccidioides brasiliensis Pb18]ODH27037.1 hypothetical protein ACO22_04324 [Paracoccidioides brasiliensis]